MNTFLQSLSAYCEANPFGKKSLIAPSRRIGQQWLDTLARSAPARPVVHVQIETPDSLAARICDDHLAAEGLEVLPSPLGPILCGRVLAEMSDFPPSQSYAEALYRTLSDLRGAGVTAGDIEAVGFRSSEYAKDLLEQFTRYQQLLQEEHYIDRPGLFLLAAEILAANPGAVGEGAILCGDGDLALQSGAERTFWRALEAQGVVVSLTSDFRAATAEPTHLSPTSLRERLETILAHRRDLGQCEPLQIRRAQGPAAEVREVLGYCLRNQISLDRVELLYTRAEVYLPLIYEQVHLLLGTDRAASYSDGIPAGFSRPGQLLQGVCAFLQNDCSQAVFRELLVSGAVQTSRPARQLVQTLDRLGIEVGHSRWEAMLADAIAAAQARGATRDRDDLQELQSILSPLLDATRELVSQPMAAPETVLGAMEIALNHLAARKSELDHNAHQRLGFALEQLLQWHRTHPGEEPLDAQLASLAALVSSTCVGARGTEPGRLFVAPYATGGHSGREFVFVLGLNDHLFPPTPQQDPLLLDEDRQRIIGEIHKPLPLSHTRLHHARETFLGLLARTAGRVRLSFSCHDLVDDRELYPSTILFALCAIVEGLPGADSKTLNDHCGPAATWLPLDPQDALEVSHASLATVCREAGSPADVRALLPEHLAEGLRAQDHWADPATFGPWNGDVAPADPGEQAKFSPSALQTLAACPRRYFFQKLLGLYPPEERDLSPDQWLTHAEFGTLFHDVACEFYRIRNSEARPFEGTQADRDEFHELLQRRIQEKKQTLPASSDHAFETTCRRLEQAADILLREDSDELSRSGLRPKWLEVSVGLTPETIGETCGTDMDLPDPIEVKLPEGTFLLNGRIDRVDAREEPAGEFAIWDYKTGASTKFKAIATLGRGRILQQDLYERMFAAALSAKGLPGRVASSGYYFTSDRGLGKRLAIDPAETRALADGILGNLLRMVQDGTYCATTDKADCAYCDYRLICGDVDTVATISKARLEECDAAGLDAFRALREIQTGGEE
ncbi:MAG: hypothetical protein HN909_04665 [Phycisphaerales bacterium]|jgi:ATP-dependent helicase/nuclease subunit B|nr:hypothetical protein [Phycisphaerales bacterium]MBT7171043.1 hypothetical protein [Phycisphaerales bacterium]